MTTEYQTFAARAGARLIPFDRSAPGQIDPFAVTPQRTQPTPGAAADTGDGKTLRLDATQRNA